MLTGRRLLRTALLLTALAADAIAGDGGDLDTGFDVRLSRRTEAPPGIEASVRSTRIYPCAGYGIRSRVTWDRDTVNLTVWGMVRPSPCVPLPAEANGSALLGNLRDSTWVLRIRYREAVDLHRLWIRGATVSARPIRATFTSVR